MKEIHLTQGRAALVDDEDAKRLDAFSWFFNGRYAETTFWDGTKSQHLLMHRFIIDAPKGSIVDHIDHNTLNNTKGNLRICTVAESNRNIRARCGTASRFKGVHVDHIQKRYKYYRAAIYKDGKREVKTFPFTPQGEIDAAMWYNEKAKQYFGEFAVLNDIT